MKLLTKSIITIAITTTLSVTAFADNLNDLQNLRINSNTMGVEKDQMMLSVASHEREAIRNQQAVNSKLAVSATTASSQNRHQLVALSQRLTADEHTLTTTLKMVGHNQATIQSLNNQAKDAQNERANNKFVAHNNQIKTQRNAQLIDKNEQNIQTLGQDIGDEVLNLHAADSQLNARVQGDEESITNNQKALTSVRSKVATTELATSHNQTQISGNSYAIHRNSQSVSQLDNNVTTNRQSIQKNSTRINSNSAGIAQNKADISGLRNDLNNLNDAVDGSYAESAAFTGLVQPYGIGKFAISTGFGYHGNAQALAIGIGERFTTHLTVKVGGAFDTATESGSAYAGIGYEF